MVAWRYARTSGRVAEQPVIVEGFVDFAYEITLLTVRHAAGTTCCPPIGHRQEDGDYRESWQPQPMSAIALERATDIAVKITDELGGRGVFGVELFVTADDQVLFSEVSPRPHDTGLVTLLSQATSEFGLHVRAILGLPVRPDDVANLGPSASAVVLADREIDAPTVAGVGQALSWLGDVGAGVRQAISSSRPPDGCCRRQRGRCGLSAGTGTRRRKRDVGQRVASGQHCQRLTDRGSVPKTGRVTHVSTIICERVG